MGRTPRRGGCWAGSTPAESWADGDTVTVTITFGTRYKMATALLEGYMLDFVTGFSNASDAETITDVDLRSSWAFGANGEALGQRLNVPVNLYAFTDVRPADPYYYAIAQIAHRYVVDGYYHDDTTREFRAAETLNRAQFCKMVVRSLTRDVNTITEGEDVGLPFTDLGEDNPTDLYWHEYIARAYELGVTTGTTATTFSPWLTLPRCQAVSMVVRAVSSYYWPAPEDPPGDYLNTWGRTFDSVHGPNAWRVEYWGLLDHIPLDGAASDPWAPIPRGEMAQLIWNAMVFVTPPHYLH